MLSTLARANIVSLCRFSWELSTYVERKRASEWGWDGEWEWEWEWDGEWQRDGDWQRDREWKRVREREIEKKENFYLFINLLVGNTNFKW